MKKNRACLYSGFALTLALLALPLARSQAADAEARGGQFFGFSSFSSFEKQVGARSTETVLTSPVMVARINWDELVASWNAEVPDGTYVKVEACAVYPGPRATRYYVMGLWSSNPARYPRESVLNQKDEDGDVSTDTLKLRRPADRFRVRVTYGGDLPERPKLKFVGVSLTDTSAELRPLAPNRAAWDRLIDVPQRSQMAYPNGNVLCSPTTVSMLMAHWARELKRPDLDRQVPEIAAAVFDTNWKGTGNWPFNTAYAGSFKGMRGYVTRMSDIAELEEWIAAGVPVGLSLCYDRLRGKGPGPNGHLVVCVGFTAEGDPIINDPGTRENVRKVFPRKNLVSAWSYSRNAAYLIYPENSTIPKDRFGHWDSWTAHVRADHE